MDIPVQNKIDSYCDSYLALKKSLRWKASGLYIRLCALAYAFEDRRADAEALLDAIGYIKKNTRWYSVLRASRVYSAAYLTAGRKNIESEFPRLANCYDVMKKAGFGSSAYLSIAAYALYSTTPAGSEQAKAERAKLIHEAMKTQHPFLTSADDYASSVILASVDRPVDDLVNEVERTYQLLRSSGFHSGNGTQLLSQILAFDPASPEEKAERCKMIFDRLKQNKNRVSSMYYGTIGFLALTGKAWEQSTEQALDAVETMKKKNCHGFGEKEFSLMIASALVCKCSLDDNEPSGTTLLRIGLGATVEAIIAAQTAACVAAAAAASAASSASS